MGISQGSKIEANDIPRIQRIIHTGNNTAGSASAPFSITFSFAPNLLILPYEWMHSTSNDYISGNSLIDTSRFSSSSFDYYHTIWVGNTGQPLRIKKSSDGKTIFWYGPDISDYIQVYNESGHQYIFYGLKSE